MTSRNVDDCARVSASGSEAGGGAPQERAGRDATSPGCVPWRGGWDAITDHARALGPDPSMESMDDQEVELAVRRAAGAQAAATARLLRFVAEFVARDLWVPLGMTTPGQWLSWALGIAPSTGRELVRVSLALRTFTATAQRFARGELSYSKVRAITRCGEPELEELLLQYADNAPASQLERIVQGFRSLEDDRDPHLERAARFRHDERHLSCSVRLPVEVGLLARELLDRVVHHLDHDGQPRDEDMPDAADHPVDAAARLDPLAARRADALVHALEIAVAHLDTDLTGAARTTLVLEGEVDSTLDQLADPGGDRGMDGAGPGVTAAGPDHGIVSSASAEAVDTPGGGSHQVAMRLRAGGMLRVSRRVLRMLSCDAGIRRITTRDGLPIDVGRTQRCVTTRQREALRLRDRTCRFPGCAATRHLHAHHVEHWVDGGPTDLDNLVLLCGAHHRFVHCHDWLVEAASAGGWTVRPPGATRPMPSVQPMLPPTAGASAEAPHRPDPFALQPAGWDGARLDLDFALEVMYQELGRLPAATG